MAESRTMCGPCWVGYHEACRPGAPAPAGCSCHVAAHEHDLCRETTAGGQPCGLKVKVVVSLDGGEGPLPPRRLCGRHGRALRAERLAGEHPVSYSRYSRGMTPIRPQRTLYGYSARCRCGWSVRCNDGRRRAEQLYRQHLKDVALPA